MEIEIRQVSPMGKRSVTIVAIVAMSSPRVSAPVLERPIFPAGKNHMNTKMHNTTAALSIFFASKLCGLIMASVPFS